MTYNDMVPFPMPTGGVCQSFSHLDPPMGTGVTRQPDSNQVIARNGQFYSLADQGNTGLKVFFASVPTCVGTSPEAIRIQYILFTKMASTTGFYLHSCYYFRKDADSNYGFTCSFGPGPIAAVTAAAEIPHCPHVPEVLAQTYVPTDPVTGAAEILARTAVPEVLEITLVPEVFAVDAFGPVQCDLPDIFQPHIPNWTSQLWVGMTKASVFKKDSPQWNILYQNPGD